MTSRHHRGHVWVQPRKVSLKFFPLSSCGSQPGRHLFNLPNWRLPEGPFLRLAMHLLSPAAGQTSRLECGPSLLLVAPICRWSIRVESLYCACFVNSKSPIMVVVVYQCNLILLHNQRGHEICPSVWLMSWWWSAPHSGPVGAPSRTLNH